MNIRPHLASPDTLELLYREDPPAFRAALADAHRADPDDPVLRVWKARLDAGGDPGARTGAPSRPTASDLMTVILVSLAAFAVAKLPAIFPRLDPVDFYRVNGAFLAALPIALYLSRAWKSPAVVRTGVAALSGFFITQANLALRGSHDAAALARLHLPIVAWTLVALVFLGGDRRNVERRVEFVRFTTELVILTGVLLLGGVLLAGLTALLFRIVGTDVLAWYFRNVVVWGAVSAPLVGTYICTRRGGDAPRLAARIASAFQPLLLFTLLPYLLLVLHRGAAAWAHRDFLTTVNAVVIGSAYIVLAMSCERGRGPARLGDALQLLLIGATLALDAVALWAIAARIRALGWWPTRSAVLGTDLVVFGLFLGLFWRQVAFMRGRRPLAALQTWIAGYLPAFSVWAALVVVVLPLTARGGLFGPRSRVGVPATTAACVYVTQPGAIAIVSAATNAVVRTIEDRSTMAEDIAAAPDGSRLYVTHQLAIPETIDTFTGRNLGPWAVGDDFGPIAVSRDGRRLYGGYASNRTGLAALDIETGAALAWADGVRVQGLLAAPAALFVRWTGGFAMRDLHSLALLREIPLSTPTGMALAPDGARVLVTQFARGSVAVVDAATGSLEREIAIPESEATGPRGIVVSPDGRAAYVAAEAPFSFLHALCALLGLVTDSHRLVVLDLEAGRLVEWIELEGSLGTPAISPDGRRVFVPLQPSKKLAVIDTATHRVTGFIELPAAVGRAVVLGPPARC